MFKKSLVAGALLASLIGAANAEWAVVSQEDNSVVMADQAVAERAKAKGTTRAVAAVGLAAERFYVGPAHASF